MDVEITQDIRLALMAERTDADGFMWAIREAQRMKEHISIDIVMLQDGTNFSEVINEVNADGIRYSKDTDSIVVDELKDAYSLTVPVPEQIFIQDVSERGTADMTLEYVFQITGELSVAFRFEYDAYYVEEYMI